LNLGKLTVCKNLNLKIFLLPELSDTDDENDLKKATQQLLSLKK